jgi:hypothetical protein
MLSAERYSNILVVIWVLFSMQSVRFLVGTFAFQYILFSWFFLVPQSDSLAIFSSLLNINVVSFHPAWSSLCKGPTKKRIRIFVTLLFSRCSKSDMGRDSSVGIATGYRLDGRGKILFSSSQLPYRLWGPSRLLCNRYRGLFPRE